VVIGEGDNHDGSDDDLAVYNHRFVLDRVHAKHSRLWQVDDGCSVQ
jgi:hypothetical protein